MSLYYQDDCVTLYHGDAFEVMAGLPDLSATAVITDPPYTERTHTKARSDASTGGRKAITSFAAFTDEQLARALSEAGRVSSGWVIATLDYRHAIKFDEHPPTGLKCQRVGVWVKTNPTPQITGDRPAQGWEAIAYFHRTKGRSKWNGGGLHGNYVSPTAAPEGHPTAKPLHMFADLIKKFTNPGDVVLDPFAGSGTTLRAAKDLGRRAIGIEINEAYCELAARRLSQEVLDLGGLS